MPTLQQTDHAVIIDTYYRYARLDAIDSGDDTGAITILDAQGQPTAEQYQDVPIYFHCDPDAQLRGNGALVGASQAFRDLDTVIVKFESDSPMIMAVNGLLRPCYAPHGVFISGANAITLREMEGDAYDGDLNFKSPPISWGTADHVWFLGKMYWVLSGTAIKYNPDNGWYLPRNAGNETACTGLHSDISEFNVVSTASGYRMWATRADSDLIWPYDSTDGLVWTDDVPLPVGSGDTELCGYPLPVVGGGWVRFDTDRFFVERRNANDEIGYPPQFFRLFRIGIKNRWNANGTENTTEEAYTAYADASAQSVFTFQVENDFAIEGGFAGLQLIQIL